MESGVSLRLRINIKGDFHEAATRQSDAAFHVACSLADHCHATLAIVHVQEPPFNVGELIMPLIADPEAERAALQKQLDAVQPSNSSFPVKRRLLHGRAANQIIQGSEKLKAEMIVMGTHGRGRLSRILMGSIAAEVVRMAPCPVLTIKLPKSRSRSRPDRREKSAAT